MSSQRRNTRAKKEETGTGRTVKEKFQQEREESVKARPLVPMNKKQQLYIDLLKTKPIVIATGYPGASKSYIPAVMAADMYKLNQIQKIYLTRPAVSSSKSLGFFKGDVVDKMSQWLGAVIPIFIDRLGKSMFEIAVEAGDIQFIPLEVAKGMSINDAWFIVEEASDLTKEEVIKLITRMGKNSVLVLAGDLRQAELKGDLGLFWLTKFVERHNLSHNFGFVDFNEVNDIVRSDAVKQFITCLVRDEKKGIE